MKTAATLFSGGGGADLGLIQAGFDVRWGVEKDEAIANCYQTNFPNHHLIVGDIRNINPQSLEPVDYLHASPPCQQYSSARKLKIVHPEAEVGVKIIRFLKVLKPRYFSLENVSNYSKSSVFTSIVNFLLESGYNVDWAEYDAVDFGVPQNRRRLFLRASKDILSPILFSERIGWHPAIADLISSLPETELAEWQKSKVKETRHRPLLVPRAGTNIKNFRVRLAHNPCPTIRSFKSWRGTHWADIVLRDSVKKISPQATARLMSFPDSYLLPSPSISQAVLGNAVPPAMMNAIAKTFTPVKLFVLR